MEHSMQTNFSFPCSFRAGRASDPGSSAIVLQCTGTRVAKQRHMSYTVVEFKQKCVAVCVQQLRFCAMVLTPQLRPNLSALQRVQVYIYMYIYAMHNRRSERRLRVSRGRRSKTCSGVCTTSSSRASRPSERLRTSRCSWAPFRSICWNKHLRTPA